MKWLFGQVWLYCLIAFLLGVLLTWLIMRFLRRPQVEVSETRGVTGGSPAAAAVAAAPLAAAVSTVDAAPPEPEPEPVPVPTVADEPAPAMAVVAPHGPGSAAPLVDGSAPSRQAGDTPPDESGETETVEPAATAEADDAADSETAEPVAPAEPDGPYGPGSALPRDGGAAPGDDYTVKGNADSMLFHTLASPYYGRTIAEVWFRTEADARRAGFTAWNERSKAKPKAAEWEAGPYPSSARPRQDGSSPADEFTVKGNADSMLFHTTTSPYYTRTKAEVWFRTPEDAEQAGFTAWNRPRQRT